MTNFDESSPIKHPETLLQEPVPEELKLLIQGSRARVNPDGSISDEALLTELDAVMHHLLAG